jgi:hypothetical protein
VDGRSDLSAATTNLAAMHVAQASNWVRAETLQPISIEAAALIAGLVLAWRYRSSGLAAVFALALPFNDVVYRLGPLTISDVLAILLIARRCRSAPWLVGPMFVWLGWAFAMMFLGLRDDSDLGSAVFSISYGIRFVLILLVAGTLNLSRSESLSCVRALRAVTILAASVSVVQVMFFRLGLPVNGVFAASGFVRPKGLSHEPSTSAVWFAMALPLLSVRDPHRRRFDGVLAAAIVVGLLLTASLNGFIVVGVQAVAGLGWILSRQENRDRAKLAFLVSVPIAMLVSILFGAQLGLLAGKVAQAAEEFSIGARPSSLADSSGREGDLVLLTAEPPPILGGVGPFASPAIAAQIQDERNTYVPASNIVISAAVESGVIGVVVLLGSLGAILMALWRRVGNQYPSFVAGFASFLAVLVGQRLLAFPQPWFLLAVVRGLNDENDVKRASADRFADTSIPTATRGANDVQNESTRAIDPVGAVKRHLLSSTLIVLFGCVLVATAALRLISSERLAISIGETGQEELAAALELPIGPVYEFIPEEEVFFINSSFGDVTASTAGDTIVVTAASSDEDAAQAELTGFSEQYVKSENASWRDALDAGRARSSALAANLSSDIEVLDQQLGDGGLSEPARSDLVQTRAQYVRELATRESDVASYELLLESDGPLGVLGAPRPEPAATVLRLLVLGGGFALATAAAIGQAVWRDSRHRRAALGSET